MKGQGMNIVLLSGGSGKRLWPLSNDIRSKQFIKLFRTGGDHESMVQRVYRQIRSADPGASVTIATSKAQVSAIHNQLGAETDVSVEPCRRDTFPAIALACAFLRDVKGLKETEAVVICPVDPYVEDGYFDCVRELYAEAEKGWKNLVLMGIQPTGPSDRYGYIRPFRDAEGNTGYTFTEKPTEEQAEAYIRAGALWNGGVFAFRLGYLLGKSRELLGTDSYRALFDGYASLPKISFDYVVAEKEPSIQVMRYSGMWKDIGTWKALAETMAETVVGRGTAAESENVHIVNELDLPILAMGLKDAVIAASPDGILVAAAEHADRIKPYVDAMEQQVMYAEKSWGNYRVIDVGSRSLTLKVTLNGGQRMSYHSHERRDEVWTVISGGGRVILDGEEWPVGPGDMVRMQAGQRHTVIADGQGLEMIEVQLGSDISAADKHKYGAVPGFPERETDRP